MNDIVAPSQRMLCDQGRKASIKDPAFTSPRGNVVSKQIVDLMPELCQTGSEPEDKFGSAQGWIP
jgi:hypothetical protein